MASGHKEDSEDSGYLSVTVSGSQLPVNKSKDGAIAKHKEISDFNAIRALNRNLFDHIQILKKQINDQCQDFVAEKMQLIRGHRREMVKQKKRNEKMESEMITANSEMRLKDTLHKDEIEKLKAEIESLEKTEKELRDKMNSLETTEFREEYEKQKREMSASKAELNNLKEKIASLERAAAERDDRTIEEMAKKHEKLEEDMATMKSDLLLKMDENDRSTKEMLSEIQKLIVSGQEKEQNVEQSPRRLQKCDTLPPINEPRSRSRADSKHNWKY